MKIAKGASPKDAPKKTPTVGDKYDTLAGNDGVWFWSDFIPVEKGKAYWLTIDAKGPGMLAWLFGYPEKTSTDFGADEGAFQEVLQAKLTGKPKDTKRGHEIVHPQVRLERPDGARRLRRMEDVFAAKDAVPPDREHAECEIRPRDDPADVAARRLLRGQRALDRDRGQGGETLGGRQGLLLMNLGWAPSAARPTTPGAAGRCWRAPRWRRDRRRRRRRP